MLEETGLQLGSKPGQARLERPLGILAYDLLHGVLGPVEFATYFFLVQMPPTAELHPLDADEHIAGWDWCTPVDLRHAAEVLDSVYLRSTTWADWGRFRAAGHRFVAEMLAV